MGYKKYDILYFFISDLQITENFQLKSYGAQYIIKFFSRYWIGSYKTTEYVSSLCVYFFKHCIELLSLSGRHYGPSERRKIFDLIASKCQIDFFTSGHWPRLEALSSNPVSECFEI